MAEVEACADARILGWFSCSSEAQFNDSGLGAGCGNEVKYSLFDVEVDV